MHAPVAMLPAGFVRFSAGGSDVVCARHVADAVREAMNAGTLYRYGEQHPQARSLAGRGIAYAVPLPNDVERVVIRHNRHGSGANYVYTDGHVAKLRWREARRDQFPDHVVRAPLAEPVD